MSAISFDELLANLHQGSALIDEEQKFISINDKREFVIPKGYNTIIAYEGDVNSQIITFELPIKHEGHNLSNCSIKKLYWKNLSSNIEGVADLTQLSIDNEKQLLQWAVPPEAFSQAGTIELSISIQDLHNGSIGFAWNTATFSSLTVAKTMNSVSYNFPPRDEILTIDEETRQIIAPSGYNNIVGFQGDRGVSKVYFIIKRYINGIDILQSDATITVFYKVLNIINTSVLMKNEYTPEIEGRNQEGMALLTWVIPDMQGELMQIYNGKFDISLQIKTSSQTWHTNTYSNLEIKPSLTSADNSLNENINEYLQNSHWWLNGNAVTKVDSLVELPGIISLRTYNEEMSENYIKQNELMPQYDNNGNLTALYLNTTKGLVNILNLFSGEYIIDAGTATELID